MTTRELWICRGCDGNPCGLEVDSGAQHPDHCPWGGTSYWNLEETIEDDADTEN